MFKILFADDEIKIRETVCDYFTAKGVGICLAANGSEAVRMSQDEDFDLIILDVMMPVMNGIDACRKIRAHSGVPVLFLSALGEERDLLSGYSSGADDYIVKPFPLSVLYEKSLRMIKRYRNITGDNLLVSGSSIDNAEIKSIWDEFYRMDKARNSADNSSGMGLAICRKILELHGFGYGCRNVKNGVEFYFSA